MTEITDELIKELRAIVERVNTEGLTEEETIAWRESLAKGHGGGGGG